MPRSRRRALLAAIGLALAAAALASRTLPSPSASRPSGAQDVSVASIPDPTNRQTSTNDQSGSLALPAPPVASIGGPGSDPRSRWPAGSVPAASSGTHPAASTPTTQPIPAPTAPLTTADPPVPTIVAPADGLLVWVVNRASRQHFGVAADSTSDGAPIVQSTSAGSAQQWRLIAASSNCFQMGLS